jgi:hypothetical protein
MTDAVAANPPPPRTTVALVSKVILDVARKEAGKDWVKANRGETLASGDKVRTGVKSVAVIKFKDNSLVRVRELSELTVTAELKGTAFSKSVNLEQGVVGFNVQKQRTDEEFRFTSPTSVASIRGTGGRLSSIDSTDTLIVIDGTVRLTNSVSSLYADVEAGFTGISNPDGTVRVRPSTLQERRAAESASRPADQDNMLEFDLRDAQGNKKQLRIEFKD